MDHDDLVIIGRVLGALAIGAAIGFERTFRGRAAGFRSHALVCIDPPTPRRGRSICAGDRRSLSSGSRRPGTSVGLNTKAQGGTRVALAFGF